MDQTLFLAFAGLSRGTMDHLNLVGWFLPFLILILPVSLILFFVAGTPAYLVLLGLQAAAMYYGLRTLAAPPRRSGFSNAHVKLMLGPFYLIACFITNILTLIGVELIHRLF